MSNLWLADLWKKLWCNHHWHYREKNQVIGRGCCRCGKQGGKYSTSSLPQLSRAERDRANKGPDGTIYV